MTRKGRLIVFEGPDGVGKTTLARAVAERLRADGAADLLELSFPGGAADSLGRVVYAIHHEPAKFGLRHDIDGTALQTLHVAAHIDTIETCIRPHLQRGGWVVLDRYWWSTWVYGMANGAPAASVDAMIDLERLHWRGVLPDLLVLIDRATPYRAESEPGYFETLRRLYADRVQDLRDPFPVRRLLNDRTPGEAVESCMALARELMAGRTLDHRVPNLFQPEPSR